VNSFTTLSSSEIQTRNWGKRLGKLLEGGEIVGLTGELGSGKTCFARGVAEGLDVGKEAWIRSPTFTLINEYDGRLPMYHIDLYRIGNARELEELNLREYLFSGGVSVVEWFEHLPEREVDEWLEINFEHAGITERKLTFTAYGKSYEELLKGLKV
jgi:tRNA threonylcarbamoyladenosine biosynthesis protein TsaE